MDGFDALRDEWVSLVMLPDSEFERISREITAQEITIEVGSKSWWKALHSTPAGSYNKLTFSF